MIFEKTKQALFRSTLLCAIGALSVGNAAVAAEDEQMEEVVVTGSYIKRSSENSPSPLSVISSADIEDLGAQGMAEVINTLPWQSGSETRSATFNGGSGTHLDAPSHFVVGGRTVDQLTVAELVNVPLAVVDLTLEAGDGPGGGGGLPSAKRPRSGHIVLLQLQPIGERQSRHRHLNISLARRA